MRGAIRAARNKASEKADNLSKGRINHAGEVLYWADSGPLICYDGDFWSQMSKFIAMKRLIFVSILLTLQGVAAQQIYKSYDQAGNVSYSSEPPKDAAKVETVTLPPPPGEDEIERARQRYQELEARDAEREQERHRQEEEALRRLQIQADLELKRQIARQQPADPVVIDPNPYQWYWDRSYRGWRHKKPWTRGSRRLKEKHADSKLRASPDTRSRRKSGRSPLSK